MFTSFGQWLSEGKDMTTATPNPALEPTLNAFELMDGLSDTKTSAKVIGTHGLSR